MRLLLTAAAMFAALPAFATDYPFEIKDMQFSPALLNLAAGDTITFTNADGTEHTATAPDGAFDTGRIAPGAKMQVTVSNSGDHPFQCMIHEAMKGMVKAK